MADLGFVEDAMGAPRGHHGLGVIDPRIVDVVEQPLVIAAHVTDFGQVRSNITREISASRRPHTWQAIQDPPRVRSATSLAPISGFPAMGLDILRGSAGIAGDLIAIKLLNCELSRVGQPGYRARGWADANPSVAIGGKRVCCAEVSKIPADIRTRASKRAVVPATLMVRTTPRFIDISFARLMLVGLFKRPQSFP